MLRVFVLCCVAALAAASPVAVPEASPVAAASPVAVADPVPQPAADPEPVPVVAAVVPAVPAVPVEAIKQEAEDAPKVQEEAVKPQGRSFDDEIFNNNNDVAKAGRQPTQADTTTGEEALLRKLNTRCAQKDTSSCVLLKMVTYFNRLLKKSSIAIGETVEIERTSAVTVSSEESSSRALEGETDEDKLTSLMTDKLFNFVRSRSMRLKLLPSADLLVTPKTEKDGGLNLDMSLQPTKDEGEYHYSTSGSACGAVSMEDAHDSPLTYFPPTVVALLVCTWCLLVPLVRLVGEVEGVSNTFPLFGFRFTSSPGHPAGPRCRALAAWRPAGLQGCRAWNGVTPGAPVSAVWRRGSAARSRCAIQFHQQGGGERKGP